MRRIISVVLIAVLFISVFSISGNADYTQASYSSTRQFLKALDELDIKYTWEGGDDKEIIRIGNNSDIMGNYYINFYFDDNNENCSIRVWDVIDYKSSMSSSVYNAVNTINAKYKTIKLYADDSDNSVTASIDLIYRTSDVGDICLEALIDIVQLLDEAYPTLAPFDK